ncbi:MAG: hypothetical protein LBD58_07130, partial [Treponema sp.]|nr:hypothetical protein [Treponema sp.]
METTFDNASPPLFPFRWGSGCPRIYASILDLVVKIPETLQFEDFPHYEPGKRGSSKMIKQREVRAANLARKRNAACGAATTSPNRPSAPGSWTGKPRDTRA